MVTSRDEFKPPVKPAMPFSGPFSGRLELLRAIEDALPAAEEAARIPRAPA
jgi:hypothetical protein